LFDALVEQVVGPTMSKPHYLQVIVPMKKVRVAVQFLVTELFVQYMIALIEEILLDLLELTNEVIQVVALAVWQMNDVE
jgi:hypothetical protein